MSEIQVKTEGISRFAKKVQTRKVKFLDDEVIIKKLTTGEVIAIQEKVDLNSKSENPNSFEVLFLVIRTGCPEFEPATNEELESIPMDALSKLSEEIMTYAGMGKK